MTTEPETSLCSVSQTRNGYDTQKKKDDLAKRIKINPLLVGPGVCVCVFAINRERRGASSFPLPRLDYDAVTSGLIRLMAWAEDVVVVGTVYIYIYI